MRKFLAIFVLICGTALGADFTLTQVKNQDSGTEAEGTAGATITAGDVLYADPTDSNKLKLASSATKVTSKVVGIALHDSISGRHIRYQTDGLITLFSADTFADAEQVVLSATAGKLAPDADLDSGDFVTFLGVGEASGTKMHIKILNTGIQKP